MAPVAAGCAITLTGATERVVLTLPGPAWIMLSLPCAADEDCALAGVSSEVEVSATALVGGRWHVSPPGRPVRAAGAP
eukprot:13541757-Alexandrium_andersonii.AAC.1